MDWALLRGSGRPGTRRVPNSYFEDYFSPGFAPVPADQWISGKFSLADENILFIGSDNGNVCVVDVDSPTPSTDFFHAHWGCVMDIEPVPGRPEELLTMSGNEIRIWSLGTPNPTSSLFLRQERKVRAASFAPDRWDLFATGGRDGCMHTWDRRVAPLPQPYSRIDGSTNCQVYRPPSREYGNAHQVNPVVEGGRTRKSARFIPARASPSITSLTYLDEHTIVTSSESDKSGIRLWDTRMLFASPTPFKSSLFAVSTDNCIYEYHPNGSGTEPVRSYVGACIRADFDMQIACSPVSDHIMCGSGDDRALIWDAQKFHAYADQPLTGPASISQRDIRPSLSLGGHRVKVHTVGYSKNAMYMLTLGDREFRIWRHMPTSRASLRDAQERIGAAFERVERLEQPREDEARRVMQRISITPGARLFLSPTRAGMAPIQKRKQPFVSPFKSAASMRLFNGETENVPPGETKERRRRRETNPFYYEYPTMHLPNFVHERHERRKRENVIAADSEVVGPESGTVTTPARPPGTLDGWLHKATDRLITESVLNEAGAAADAPTTSPHKLQLVQPQPTMAAAAASPAVTVNGRRSSVRNILHYFKSNRVKTEE